MALRIILNLNAIAEVLETFTINPAIGGQLTFKKGEKIEGQFDNPQDGLWIKYNGLVANIPTSNPIKIHLANAE